MTLQRVAFVGLILCMSSLVGATAPASQPAERTLHVGELPLTMDRATPQQAEWLKTYLPKTKTFDAVLTDAPINPEDGWRLVRVSFPSPMVTPWPENNVVPGELYLPAKREGKIPAAIVLDILEGSAIVPRGLARGLAQQGVAALYIPMACYSVRRPAGNVHIKYFADHPEATADNLRQSVMDIRRAKALLAALPEVDPAHISIAGVSMGGIMTSLAAGVDGEFYRVAPILAGGDIAAITFHAREARAIREACEAKGITEVQLGKLLEPVDPLSFASRIDPGKCLMINALHDEVIPRASTDALNKAIGSPQIFFVPVGHYGAVLFLPNIRQRTIDFIKGKKVEKLEFDRTIDR